MPEPLSLDPKLDLSAAPALHATLLSRVNDDLVLDATRVTHMGALCTQILIAFARAVRDVGKQMSLINVNDRVLGQLRAMGLTPERIAEGAP